MRKHLATILIAVLLLNVMGYYGVFLGYRYTHQVRFTNKINDENYNEADLRTIKVPLAVPYYGDTDFQRVDGEIRYDGQFYRLLKQKLVKDTLMIVMVRDHKRGQIHEVLADYVKSFTDHATDRSEGKGIPSFIKEYVASGFATESHTGGWSFKIAFAALDESLSSPDRALASPPPKG